MTAQNQRKPARDAAPAPNLQDRYKPLGLRAVVAAAMQSRKDAAEDERARRERDIPACLRPLYE